MNNTTKASSFFLEGLQIAFIVLKLAGIIDWPWIWVLAPMWISLAIFIVIVIVCLIIEIVKDHKRYK